MKNKTLSFVLAGILVAPLGVAAAEWTFPEGAACKLRVPHDPELNYPDGFKATVRFS